MLEKIFGWVFLGLILLAIFMFWGMVFLSNDRTNLTNSPLWLRIVLTTILSVATAGWLFLFAKSAGEDEKTYNDTRRALLKKYMELEKELGEEEARKRIEEIQRKALLETYKR